MVTTGCDEDASDRQLVAGTSNLTAAEQELVELQPVEEVVEVAPAPAPRPRRTQPTQRASTVYAEPVYRAEPAYTPQPQVVKKTNIKRDAAIGAGVGATVGAIAHDRNRLKGALVGGVIGGAAGAIVGATIDTQERVIYR